MLIQRNIDNNMSVLHVNARSLHTHLDYIQVYLRTWNHNCSVIAISESRANNDSILLLNIPDYISTFRNLTSGRGGDVALLVRNCFKFNVRDHITMCGCGADSACESCMLSRRCWHTPRMWSASNVTRSAFSLSDTVMGATGHCHSWLLRRSR